MRQRHCSNILAGLAAELDASLVPENAKRALVALTSRLAWLQSSCYIECRLGSADAARVDFLAAIPCDERDGAWRAIASCEPGKAAGLADAARLLEVWRDPATSLNRSVPVAWLEFDDVLQQAATGSSSANVCVSLIDTYRDPFAPLPTQPATRACRLAVEAAQLIRRRELDATEHAQLVACFQHLPAEAHWVHLSIMSRRTPAQLKLYGVFPRHALLQFLGDVDWRGDLSEVCKVLDVYGDRDRMADQIYVDLPVRSENAGDAELGLCFAQQHLRYARDTDPARASLLAQLVRAGLCTNAQAVALAGWPTPLCEGVQRLVFDRWLDIKLVCGRAPGLLAKAYLGFRARAPAFGLGLTKRAQPVEAAFAAPLHR